MLEILVAGGHRQQQVKHVHTQPARQGNQGEWPDWIAPSLQNGLQTIGAERPWLHQLQAVELAHAGKHVALATSTGSGKSLAYWVPALSAVAAETEHHHRIESVHARGTVLYLSPTKALAHDQLASLQSLITASGLDHVVASTCDGDTPFEMRKWIQAHGDVVLTNPDYMHYAMLPSHARWARFFKRLRYVIIDEGHSYRGVFGAHIALILRRLRRIAAYYRGSGNQSTHVDLTFIVASATTSDPSLSAARLVGLDPDDVTAVTEDHSPQGTKTFVLWQPPQLLPRDSIETTTAHGDASDFGFQPVHSLGLTDEWTLSGVDDDLTSPSALDETFVDALPNEQPRRSVTVEAGDLVADLAANNIRTLAFTRSRRGAENVARHIQDQLQLISPNLAGSVAAYRGGYLPEERRALEHALRVGDIKALATTNALELGVNISGLDAVVIVGWPGTRVSMWQQAGRAGRAGSDGLVVFIAREDPLDTYLVNNPEAIFDAPLEATVFDPHNPYVLAGHLCSAAAELPLRDNEIDAWGGQVAVSLLDQLCERGTLRRRTQGWFWTHEQKAADFVNVRGAGGAPVQVVERESGRLLGTVDAASADGHVHAGAVYVHQGETYVVAEYDLEESLAFVDREEVSYTTWARDVTSIEIVDVRKETSWDVDLGGQSTGARPHVEWGFGEVKVHGQVVSFNRRRIPSGEIISHDSLDLPIRTLTTTAVWWTVSAQLLEVAELDGEETPGALHAAEHASIGLLPLLATCDRWDLGGVSTALHVDTERATVFVYDALPGGAGFAERGFAMARQWLTATLEAIESCACVEGCPACVQSPKCGNGNNPLSKAGATRLLKCVLGLASP